MKYPFTFFLFSVLVGALAACDDPADDGSPLTERERKKLHSEVINRFHAMIKYAEAGELDNILMHFDPAGGGVYIDGLTRYKNLDDMMVNLRATWKVGKQDYGIPETQVVVVSRQYAWVASSSTLNTANRDGTVFQPRPWSLSTLWVKKDGEWFIHSFHQSAGDLKAVEGGS